MTIDFMKDLRDAADPKFVRHVLNHTIADDCSLKPDKDDHRYKGIDDAWIRYVTGGKSAFRVIYLRKGADVYLYRAGPHSVEDHLTEPDDLALSVSVTASPLTGAANAGGAPLLLKTTEKRYLNQYLQSMYHLKHKSICIVAPRIEPALLDSKHHFGRFLDKAVEEGTCVAVVTAPQDKETMPLYRALEKREILVYFLDALNTKLYLFEIDTGNVVKWQQPPPCAMVVGSSDFTAAGLGMDDQPANEELCCALPAPMLGEVKQYADGLTLRADDCIKYFQQLARSQRQ
jgi:hypothetical protein